MQKSNWKYLIAFILFVAFWVWYEMYKPKPINWTVTYKKEDKIPYGNKILFEMLPSLFGNKPVRTNYLTVYEDSRAQSDTVQVIENHIFIQREFQLSEAEVIWLLDYVRKGGHVFIAAERIMSPLADSLHLESNFTDIFGVDSLGLNFEEQNRRQPYPYTFRRGMVTANITSYDTTNSQILSRDSENRPTFIRTNYGMGGFYLSVTPKIFTNYNMLYRNNAQYIADALSYMPPNPVCWQAYYHTGSLNEGSLLRVILQHTALRWALYTFLLGAFAFVIFKGKRTQRIIPIIKPLGNATLEFIQTVSRLYYNKREHQNIALKRILYFEESLRQRYYFSAQEMETPEFAQALSAKSLVSLPEVVALLSLLRRAKNTTSLEESSLVDLSKAIDNFKKKSA